MAEGELITIGCDGWIRVWDLESIEHAAPIDLESDEGFYLLDPMNEIHVSADAILRSITRSKEPMGPDENFWFLQDAGGGIWSVDLSFSLTMRKLRKIRQVNSKVSRWMKKYLSTKGKYFSVTRAPSRASLPRPSRGWWCLAARTGASACTTSRGR